MNILWSEKNDIDKGSWWAAILVGTRIEDTHGIYVNVLNELLGII